jgi:glycosyltransferase involved in cell wall biosynthesis
LRILFLAPQPFFEVRGTPLAVRAMLRALAALGHEIDLLSYAQGVPSAIPGVRHRRSLRLPIGRVRAGASFAKLLLDVPFTIEALWLLATRRYQVVHAVEEAAHLIAPFARLLGVPLVADVDSSIPEQLKESGFARRGPFLWLAEALENHALRHSAAVVTVCKALTDGVRRRAPSARVFQIEDPPLLDGRAATKPAEVAALGRALGLEPGPVVVYTGNFEPYQGVESLVDAAALTPEAQFLFVGGEPEEIARMKARASGGDARCCFAGKRPPEDLPLLLALADVLCSPRSRGSNTPFKIYSYLASGKPLVATRIESHTQLLDASLAFLAEPTPGALAGALRAALADPEDAATRAARGKALVEREFSVARHAEKVKRAYEAVARG